MVIVHKAKEIGATMTISTAQTDGRELLNLKVSLESKLRVLNALLRDLDEIEAARADNHRRRMEALEKRAYVTLKEARACLN